MRRSIIFIAVVFGMVCNMAPEVLADTMTDLLDIQQSLPSLLGKLVKLKAGGQDISYPMRIL